MFLHFSSFYVIWVPLDPNPIAPSSIHLHESYQCCPNLYQDSPRSKTVHCPTAWPIPTLKSSD